jgi:hypothetical protein
MRSVIHVFLFGSLSKGNKGGEHHPVQLDLRAPKRIPEVLDLLRIELQDVSLAMVNYRSVPKDWLVHPGDRLSLFPREYPIFADWMDHRCV